MTARNFTVFPVLVACLFVTRVAIAETFAITNTTVHTLGQPGSLENATIVIKDGRISAVGKNVSVPGGAEVLDARGMVVTPGIFDPISYLGIVEISGVEESVDDALNNSYGPAFSVADAVNPRSTLIAINRIEGVTRAFVVPDAAEGGNVIVGQAAIIHLGGVDEYLIERQAGMIAFLGEAGSGIAGGSRAGAMLRLREALQDAKDFKANRDSFDAGQRRAYALSRLDLEAMQPVIEGKMPLIAYASRVSDIEALLSLADDAGIRLVIVGGAEAWMIADKIAAAEVPVIINPLANLPGSFESINARLENAASLHRAGVQIAFAIGDSHNARNLTQSAGVAVAYGLPWEAGLRAITVNPAKIFGQESNCCTIEVGKEADIVVWDGDPLEVTTFATQVFIRGVKMSMESRQTLLRDRYLELETELPPAYHLPE